MNGSSAAIVLMLAAESAIAQGPRNLLQDPSTKQGAEAWRPRGEATMDEFGGRPRFVVRNGGRFFHQVTLPKDAAGRFVLFAAWASGERVEQDITDRPYLYGMTYSAEGRIVAYHQGGAMRSSAARPNERTVLWGVFPVPEDAAQISFQLGQGLRRGVPHTGSAARFYEPGLFLFDTRAEAEAFAERYPFGGVPQR